MSVQDFRRVIEPLRARALDRASARRRERQQPSSALMLRVEAAERWAALIAETLRALADSIPGLHPFRRLAQGGWVVGLDGTETIASHGGRPRCARSRIEVCLTMPQGGGPVQLVCRRTVLDRDLDVLRHELPLVNLSEQECAAWIEGACLEFAAALLARRATLGCSRLSA
jgi:hypothetical protein